MYELIITLSGLGSVEPRALAATSTLEIGVMRAAQREGQKHLVGDEGP